MPKSRHTQHPPAFTLVELILVMALLAVVMAMAAPALGRSMRARYLADEARRFLALTEYARDESLSQGLPISVWINPATGQFGAETKGGYPGDARRDRRFELNPDVHFELSDATAKSGVVQAVEFAADGLPEVTSVDSLRLVDRFAAAYTIALTSDAWVSGSSRGDFGPEFPGYRWELAQSNWAGDAAMSELALRVYFQVQGGEQNISLNTLASQSVPGL